MKPLLRVLTSSKLPSPDPLRLAGYSRWDLDQALLHYKNRLFDSMMLSVCCDDTVMCNYTRMIEQAQRNHDYLYEHLT